MVFQFPESQLFEDTAEREMIFGLRTFKMDLDEAKIMHIVYDGSWFFKRCDVTIAISNVGGQMRKSQPSVLAMNPDIIVVDDTRQVMRLLKSLQTDENKTIILIS